MEYKLIELYLRICDFEEVCLKEYADDWEAESSLSGYFYFYNQRPHQSLKNKRRFEVYQAGLKAKENKEPKEPICNIKNPPVKSAFAV